MNANTMDEQQKSSGQARVQLMSTRVRDALSRLNDKPDPLQANQNGS